MRKHTNLLCYSTLLLLFAGCSISTENFPEPDKLRMAIVQSIEIPQIEGNSNVICESTMKYCGNISSAERNAIYSPELFKYPYTKILAKNYQGRIWYDERLKLETRDSLLQNNALHILIGGNAITNTSVEIFERYSHNRKHYLAVDKIFQYEGGIWKCTNKNTNSE